MYINVIIPFYKNDKTILNLMRSIEDQDYKKFKVWVVLDGEQKKAEAQLVKWYESKEFDFEWCIERTQELKEDQWVRIKNNKGASFARNWGANMSAQDKQPIEGCKPNKDDILFFVDGDCEIYPGMFRSIVTEFERDKDLGFVYGNYRFEHQSEFYSKPFDKELLDTMNYICTMSPVKRDVYNKVGGFKIVPYFQDWSFFHDVVKLGYKGKYINEFIFSTKKPNEKSISGTQGLSLAEKCKEFRKWQGIKDKELVVTTFAAPLQAIQRAKMLDADYVGSVPGSRSSMFPSNLKFENWKATYCVGFFGQSVEAIVNHLGVCVGKKIMHFIGSDVWFLRQFHNAEALKGIREFLNKQDLKIFANHPNLVKELDEIGIEAELLYTPIYDIDRFKGEPLPKDFTIGVFFSDVNPAHSLDGAGGRSLNYISLDIAKSLPHIKFKFFGDGEKYTEGNIEFCGKIPSDKMPQFINSCSATIRLTIHDGMPQLPIQFMLQGRQALVTAPNVPYSLQTTFGSEIEDDTKVKDEIINTINDMIKNQDSFYNNRDEVIELYKGMMSESYFKYRINQVVEEAKNNERKNDEHGKDRSGNDVAKRNRSTKTNNSGKKHTNKRSKNTKR